jgi:hypothetical protein
LKTALLQPQGPHPKCAMYYPTVGEWVRVSGRRDVYLVLSTNYTAHAAEVCRKADGAAAAESVPFDLLESAEFDGAQNGAGDHASRLAAIRQVLSSSEAHICLGCVLIDEIQQSLFTTQEAIRRSEELIRASDLEIQRMRTLNCK